MTAFVERHGGMGHITVHATDDGDTTWHVKHPKVTDGIEHAFQAHQGMFVVKAAQGTRTPKTDIRGDVLTPRFGDAGLTLVDNGGTDTCEVLIETRRPGDSVWHAYTTLPAATSHNVKMEVAGNNYVRATLKNPSGGDWWLTLDADTHANSATKAIPLSDAPPEPQIEFDSFPAYDDGTTPPTPIYVRNTWDEVAGTWLVEYSADGSDWTYAPTGTVVFQTRRIQMGHVLLPWSSSGPLVPPSGANHAEITIRSLDQGMVAINRDAGPVDVDTDQLFGDNGRYELESLDEINNADWATLSGTGTLRVVFSYRPNHSNS